MRNFHEITFNFKIKSLLTFSMQAHSTFNIYYSNIDTSSKNNLKKIISSSLFFFSCDNYICST